MMKRDEVILTGGGDQDFSPNPRPAFNESARPPLFAMAMLLLLFTIPAMCNPNNGTLLTGTPGTYWTTFNDSSEFCWPQGTGPWPRCWKMDEEVVNGDPTYGTGLGQIAINPTGGSSLLVWANAAPKPGQPQRNHVNANYRVITSGATGRWKYGLSAQMDPGQSGVNDPTIAGQTGPEFSMANRKTAPVLGPLVSAQLT